MTGEAVAGLGPSGHPKARRRLLLLLLPGRRWGTYGGGCFRSLRWLSAFPAGFRGLPSRFSVGLGSLSRASPLLFLFLVPSPRLVATATPRRHLGDWERSRRRPRETSRSPAEEPPRLPLPAAAAAPEPHSSGSVLGGGGRLRWPMSCLVPGGAGPLHPCSFLVLAPSRRVQNLQAVFRAGSFFAEKAFAAFLKVFIDDYHIRKLELESSSTKDLVDIFARLQGGKIISFNKVEDLCISARSQQEAKKLPWFTSGNKRLYFDTHAVVRLLEEKGFTTQQAEIIVSALVKIMNNNMEVVSQDMVTKVHQEITVQQIMSQIAGVKKDMVILEKSEFSTLRAENEKLILELQQLKQRMMDEILKVRADNKLDFNLEKSRVKELYALNEKKLLEVRTEVLALQAQQLRALTQTERKIDTEVAGLKTMLESHKLDNIKYLAGSVFTCLTVALGFYRLWI